ncbi:PAS domain S-box-containing protein [Halorubrum vacuolatum]|uniref:histidine kinase n=1 Tax=Halorubrum vacuolatum TaxID=63740 RepID=A0A238XVV6_HALVU|nr:PAS domain S-box-containing protein [Halorubrum vacuolatum]
MSTLPPGLALVAWTLELGPAPQIQLAPIMFIPHALLDAYAFNRAEMFERYPTTSRAAERTAINDLADPVIALAPDRRIVSLNPAAETVLGMQAEDARNRPITEFLSVDVPDGRASDETDSATETNEVTLTVDRERRIYAVSVSVLADPRGIEVGYTVVLSDVTERERRRQQLEVLNRILRHNLRNDAGVVHGYGELLVDQLEDPELRRMADAIERRAGALATLGDKANTVETLLSEVDPAPVDIDALAGSTIDDARQRHPDAVIEYVSDIDDPTLDIREDAFRAALTNTVENAVEHHDGHGCTNGNGSPWIRVALRVERADGDESVPSAATLVCTVEDDGPGIPDHELQAIEAGQETALEHGSGLGLWIVEWAAAALGATVEYEEREPRGTRMRMHVPLRGETGTDQREMDG